MPAVDSVICRDLSVIIGLHRLIYRPVCLAYMNNKATQSIYTRYSHTTCYRLTYDLDFLRTKLTTASIAERSPGPVLGSSLLLLVVDIEPFLSNFNKYGNIFVC